MVGLPPTTGALTPEAVEPALKAIGRADAVVLGPGLGRTDGARAFAREMFERVDVPLVIDADGLNALAGVFPEDLPQRRWPTVLTPHAGELGRLLDVDSSEVERAPSASRARGGRRSRARSSCSRATTRSCRAPERRVAISRGGAPALATAGTGDVLSGVIGAMLAKGLPAAQAACAAVYAHVRAGQIAAAPHGPDGVIASDVIERAARGARGLDLGAAMALTVRDIMDADPVERDRRGLGRDWCCDVMREHDLRGVPVVNEGGRCVGIITEADLVLSGEGEDFHLPHYFELFGGVVFLESMTKFEERRARRSPPPRRT